MLNKCRLTVTLTNISFLEWAKGTQWIHLFTELYDRNPPSHIQTLLMVIQGKVLRRSYAEPPGDTETAKGSLLLD